MPTLAEATQPRDMSTLDPVAAPPSQPPTPPSRANLPGANPLGLGTLPAVFGTAPDFQRNFYRPGVSQSRIPPLAASASIATGAATKSQILVEKGTGGSSIDLQVNGVDNPVQTTLNLTGSGVKYGPGPGQVIISSAGDQVIHGDPLWELDPGYNCFRDDFYHGDFGTAITTGGLGDGWSFSGGATGFLYSTAAGLTPHNRGELGWYLSSSVPDSPAWLVHGPEAYYAGTAFVLMAPLLDYPSWKLVYVFRFALAYGSTTALDLTNRSFYIGLASVAASATQTNRPQIFIGLRYDTDTTSPSINDSTFHFEVVNNGFVGSGAQSRNNTQGTIVDTGVTPVEDTYYRLEIVCTVAGMVTMSLNGSTPQSFTFPASSIAVGTVSGGALAGSQMYITDSGDILPFAMGSNVSVLGLTSPDTSFNGSWLLNSIQDNASKITKFYTGGAIGGHALSGSAIISGYPGFALAAIFGNASTGTASINNTGFLIDFCSLLENPGVAGSGTPDPTKDRYW